MLNIENISDQVKRNCEIADAKSWGTYSLCGLLLRLRDQYRWEKRMEPWAEIKHIEILSWVAEKEKTWDSLAKEPFKDINIGHNRFTPFDLDPINDILKPINFLYGAGYIGGLRPTFFLGKIDRTWKEEDFYVYLLDNEIARDVGAMPALSQGDSIFLRKDPLRYFLWDRLKEASAKGAETALSLGFKAYGFDENKMSGKPENIISGMEGVIREELESYLYHELGEVYAARFLGEEWKELIAIFPNSRIEQFIRGVKDVMADTIEKGMLRHIIEKKKTGSLGFYISQLGGFRKLIFNEITDAFKKFAEARDLGLIDEARRSGYEKARKYAERLLEIYGKKEEMGTGWIRERIEEEFLTNKNL